MPIGWDCCPVINNASAYLYGCEDYFAELYAHVSVMAPPGPPMMPGDSAGCDSWNFLYYGN